MTVARAHSSSPRAGSASARTLRRRHRRAGTRAAETRRVQSSHHSPVAAAIARRIEALERELTAIRLLRIEVEQVRPGLLPDRGADGWRSNAAERYSERLDELRVGLAGAERLLADAEGAVLRDLDVARVELVGAAGGASWTN